MYIERNSEPQITRFQSDTDTNLLRRVLGLRLCAHNRCTCVSEHTNLIQRYAKTSTLVPPVDLPDCSCHPLYLGSYGKACSLKANMLLVSLMISRSSADPNNYARKAMVSFSL